jgi:FkbM family methyltransferase
MGGRQQVIDDVRRWARRTALDSRYGDRLRRVKRAFEPAYIADDRRDLEHLRAMLAAVLAADANCIDVGAHEGLVLADMVRLAPHGRHIAYEPLPHLAERLTTRFPGVDVRRAALSDMNGEASFVHVVTRPGWSGFRERPYPAEERTEQITVDVQRLDDALPAGYVPTFIKIDVEGAELAVLRGAEHTLADHHPIVAFEHGLGSADFYGTRPEDVFDILAGHAGLRILDLEGGGPYSRSRFVQAFERGERVNFLARP